MEFQVIWWVISSSNYVSSSLSVLYISISKWSICSWAEKLYGRFHFPQVSSASLTAALTPQAIGMLEFNKQIKKKKLFSLGRSIFTTLAAMILQTCSCLSVLLGAWYWLNKKILTYVRVSYEGSYSQRKEMSTNRGASLDWRSRLHTLWFWGVQESPFKVYLKLRCMMYWAVAYSPGDKVCLGGSPWSVTLLSSASPQQNRFVWEDSEGSNVLLFWH